MPHPVHRRNYFDATDALVYVIDSFDRKRIVESGSELDIILEVRAARIPLHDAGQLSLQQVHMGGGRGAGTCLASAKFQGGRTLACSPPLTHTPPTPHTHTGICCRRRR